jgi:hypothetical protein
MLYRLLFAVFLLTPRILWAQTIDKIALPEGCYYQGWPMICHGNLYFQIRNRSGHSQLCEYDRTGATRLIPNPDNGNPGYFGFPMVLEDTLFAVYKDSLGHGHLARFMASNCN